ncbi:DUF655 domain-containing protein [Halomarina litorea]|uniref:DUF655 domain-containing protein n=1 Tax=Halomarina litorea TaxID=2961595 RepID=UPI0020C4539F|nr:DUF655 domain-containing protein [Halomarina sp. BCD28]
MSPADSDAVAVVLDYLPHGRADDDRPQYQKPALVHALGVEDFGLSECVLADDADLSIGDRFALGDEGIEEVRKVSFDQISGGARSELQYAVEEIVEADERRFVDHYNEAQPITLRLHQLNLLPGIGKKLRNTILEERKRQPFESFEDLDSRVSGLHDPKEILVERIMEELREEDLKYRSFVR